MSTRGTDPFVIVIVGAGPRGTGILERLLANMAELVASHPVRVEMVDPFPPGAGRIWRADQSPLMWMNTMAETVTMFTDELVRCDGPIRRGPTLSEWAAAEGGPPGFSGMSFASRQLLGRYLSWVFDRVTADRPANVTVTVHQTLAVRVAGGPRTRQQVWLKDRADPLVADVLILALGHLDAEPGKDDQRMLDFAAGHGLRYLRCAYSADLDLSILRPGEKVVLRGLGLAFVDLMMLVTEGRGGEFRAGRGGLRYLPSGKEPRLYAGSRRGVPYRAKFGYRLAGRPPPLPRFFDAPAVNAKFAAHEHIDFRADLWPLMAKEIGWGYYHELFTAHPERVTVSTDEFFANYTRLDFGSAELREVIETGVPAAEDRLDFGALDRPLDGLRFADSGDLQDHLRAHIAADIDRRSDPAHSADLGAFLALLSVHGQLPEVMATGKLSARSYVEDLAGWWQGFFEYFGSGPPAYRSRQMLALARAGVLDFLGAGMWLAADEDRGVFRAGGVSTPHTVETTAAVDARLPGADLPTCTDALLRGQYECGGASQQLLTDEYGFHHATGLLRVSATDFQMIDRRGRPHPRRYAIGPFTDVTHFGTFARPCTNAMSFRQNDRLARSVLRFLSSVRLT